MKTIQTILKLTFVILFISACSHKKTANKPNNKNVQIADLQIDDTKKGRNIISENTRVYINQEQLPYFRTDTSAQRILLIGDSMSKWLRYRLQDYCQKNGHKLYTVTWVSGNTDWFAKYDTLNYYISKEKISYVFLVLGANELFIKDFSNQRGANVDKIVNRLAGVKWVWVGPPNWKKDKGINACLLEKLSNRKFFVSKDLKFKRQSDGMHPTVSSCSMWMDSIVCWINKQSTSRIKLSVPDSSYNIKPDAVLLSPLPE